MGNTYSFLDTNASITGPGGSINLGNGAGVAKEGITVDMVGDKNKMDIGADGQGMHTLIASEACEVKVSLLKTSPVNKQLMNMYNLQSAGGGALWGINVITVNNSALGDSITVTQVAFKKKTNLVYATEGNMNVWAFDGVYNDTVLGGGL